MRKPFLFISIFLLAIYAVLGHGIRDGSADIIPQLDNNVQETKERRTEPQIDNTVQRIQESSIGSVSLLDNAVKETAQNIHKKLIEEKAQKVAFSQISYRGTMPPFGVYWINQLTAELANMPNRSYIILSGAQAGADRMIVGEITDVADVIRVFIRLIRSEDRTIENSFQSDFERSAVLMMLSGGS